MQVFDGFLCEIDGNIAQRGVSTRKDDECESVAFVLTREREARSDVNNNEKTSMSKRMKISPKFM